MYPQPVYHQPHYGGYEFGAAGDQGLQGLGYLLGQLGSGAATSVMEDPAIQATITDLKEQCQVRAKQGVTEWMMENWPVLAFGAFAILVGNYITLSLALVQAGASRRRKLRKTTG